MPETTTKENKNNTGQVTNNVNAPQKEKIAVQQPVDSLATTDVTKELSPEHTAIIAKDATQQQTEKVAPQSTTPYTPGMYSENKNAGKATAATGNNTNVSAAQQTANTTTQGATTQPDETPATNVATAKQEEISATTQTVNNAEAKTAETEKITSVAATVESQTTNAANTVSSKASAEVEKRNETSATSDNKTSEKEETTTEDTNNTNTNKSVSTEKQKESLNLLTTIVGDCSKKGVEINNAKDVAIVQKHLFRIGLLSKTLYEKEKVSGDKTISIDAIPSTIEAIDSFQQKILGYSTRYGYITTNGDTIYKLTTISKDDVSKKLEAIKETEKKEKEQKKIKVIQSLPATKEFAKEFIEQVNNDWARVDKSLQYIALYNPDLMKLLIDATDYTDSDDLSLFVCKNLSDTQMSSVNKELLEKFLDEINDSSIGLAYASWASPIVGYFVNDAHEEDFKQIDRLKKVLGIDEETEKKINTDKDYQFKLLMSKKRLTPEQIHKARNYINEQDEEKRKEYFYQLQSKVEYANQRDNEAKENNIKVEKSKGGTCNISSLAMALKFHGVKNPYPNIQFEDALEKIRQDNKYSSRTQIGGLKQIAKYFNIEFNYFKDSEDKILKKEWYFKNLSPLLVTGSSAIASIQGHVVRIENISKDGLIIDDPYGKLDISKRRKNSYKGGYEKYNKSPWKWDSEGSSNEGEDNLWDWKDIEQYKMHWIATLK